MEACRREASIVHLPSCCLSTHLESLRMLVDKQTWNVAELAQNNWDGKASYHQTSSVEPESLFRMSEDRPVPVKHAICGLADELPIWPVWPLAL